MLHYLSYLNIWLKLPRPFRYSMGVAQLKKVMFKTMNYWNGIWLERNWITNRNSSLKKYFFKMFSVDNYLEERLKWWSCNAAHKQIIKIKQVEFFCLSFWPTNLFFKITISSYFFFWVLMFHVSQYEGMCNMYIT